MISKIFLLFFVLVGVTFISSEDEFFSIPMLRTIQDEIFQRMYQYTQGSWNQTGKFHTYHIFPIVLKMRSYFALMKLYHGIELERYFSQDEYLERPYALARILDKLQNASDVKLKFPNAVFHDRRIELWRLLDDLKIRFHTEAYEISFEPENKKSVLKTINNWISKVTNRLQPSLIYYQKKMYYYETFLRFTGCWESTKTRSASFWLYAPDAPDFTFKQEGSKEGRVVHFFSAKDTVGYYEDVNRRFEAIRVPFKNNDFGMVVMLPYHNQTLEIFKNFTSADYRQLLERVEEYHEIIDYTIPVISSATVSINRNGVSINSDESCNDTEIPEEIVTKHLVRSFIVDRPFGIIIYHEPSSLVLMYALIRDLRSSVWYPTKFKLQIDM